MSQSQYMPLKEPFFYQGSTVSFQSSDKTEKLMQFARQHDYTIGTKQENTQSSIYLKKSSLVVGKFKQAKDRLDELNNYANKTGIFSNDEELINNLIVLTQKNIGEIQSQILELQTYDIQSDKILRQSQQSVNMARSIIQILQSRLLDITDSFKQIIQQTTQTSKTNEEQQNQFNANVKDTKVRKRQMFLTQTSSSSRSQNNSDSTCISVNEELENQVISQRAASMKNIKKLLEEVSKAFSKLGTIVKIHEQMIERIDQNTDDSLYNIELGRKELNQIHKDVSSNRGFMLKIFLILVIFAVIYIVFLL